MIPEPLLAPAFPAPAAPEPRLPEPPAPFPLPRLDAQVKLPAAEAEVPVGNVTPSTAGAPQVGGSVMQMVNWPCVSVLV